MYPASRPRDPDKDKRLQKEVQAATHITLKSVNYRYRVISRAHVLHFVYGTLSCEQWFMAI